MAKTDPFDFLGNDKVYFDNRKEIIRKLDLIIRIRWFVSPFVFVILWVSSLFGISVQQNLSMIPIMINTSIILSLNIVYKILLKKLSDLRPLIYLQLFIDTLHFSLTIYQTGGITSPFTFLYLGVILASAILISRLATTVSVLLASVMYSLLITLELTGVLKHNKVFIPLAGMENIGSYVILAWLFNIASFFAIAFFATFLFSEIRKQQLILKRTNYTLDKKIRNFMLLYRTSEAINRYDSFNDLVDYILTELLNFLKLDRAILYLIKDREFLKLFMMVHRHSDHELPSQDGKTDITGSLEIPLRKDAGLTARTALSNQAVNITDPSSSPLINKELAKKIGMNPFAMAPLAVNNQVLGVLGIDRNIKNGAISDEEFKILKIFANYAAIALQCHRQAWQFPKPQLDKDDYHAGRED